ncbi:hypothetical protein ARMSODRAFT_982036 [Armillaria solidipes]|uniref:Uncharacterized protein n=1 Tax=Armillaria solidipes TaxID=1076256 RepID=A0A2H3BCM6_9AGAR|nr:hypothetical protein ARMSODRAFT_982036 [Armillaria solidipes]
MPGRIQSFQEKRNYILDHHIVAFKKLKMPSSQDKMALKTKDCYLALRARIYSASKPHGTYVPIPTQICSQNRFPLVEAVFSGMKTQPFIHDRVVQVAVGKHIHRFRVFVKNHKNLPVMDVGGKCWHGDIVVMCIGVAHGMYVANMRGKDRLLSDWLVKKKQIRAPGKARLPPSHAKGSPISKTVEGKSDDSVFTGLKYEPHRKK